MRTEKSKVALVTSQPSPQGWAKAYVFISSTFGDMHAERDYLVKRVFPDLQEWCERRRIRLIDVDLRWGVTEQQAAESRNVVKLCLSAIDVCRPFFICLLGQRRGTVVRSEDVSSETLKAFPRLKRVLGAHSLTELEVLHAIEKPLSSGRGIELARHAFFYLRDPSYLAEMPDNRALRRLYTNDSPTIARDDRATRDLREKRILRARGTVRWYRAKWDPRASTPELTIPLDCSWRLEKNRRNWRALWRSAGITLDENARAIVPGTPEEAAAQSFNRRITTGRLSNFCVQSAAAGREGAELASVIRDDLERAIAEQFPEHREASSGNALDQERDEQEEFLFLHSEGFLERPGVFDQLDNYAANPNQLFPLVLTGEGGVGKSTLLASWVRHRRSAPRGAQSFHVRFVGVSERSATIDAVLRLLLEEIGKARPSLNLVLPAEPAALRQALPDLLAAIGASGAAVIVVDALDQLDAGLSDLSWLPRTLPANVKLIVSFRASEDPAAKAFERQITERAARGEAKLERVSSFDNIAHRRALATAFLNEYMKELDESAMDALVRLPGASNPLFLKVVLAELRVFGSFPNLEAHISNTFGDTPLTAFDAVLARLERDPGYVGVNPGDAVPLLFGFLAHARRGLSRAELVELLVEHYPWTTGALDTERGANAVDAVNLYVRQVRRFLARREGRYDFFYDSFKAAASKRYTSERSASEWHGLIAAHFRAQPLRLTPADEKGFGAPNGRKLDEQPWQETRAGLWKDVKTTLCNVDFIEAKCAAGRARALLEDFESAERVAPAESGLEDNAWSEWRQFVRLEAHNFEQRADEYPSLVRQQALNQPKKGRVSEATEKLMKSRPRTHSVCFERLNRPDWFHPSICLRIHHRRAKHLVAASGRAVSCDHTGALACWDLDTGAVVQEMPGPTSDVTVLSLPRSDRVLAGFEDGSVIVYDAHSGDMLHARVGTQSMAVLGCDNNAVVSVAARDGRARAVEWSVEDGAEIQAYVLPGAAARKIWLASAERVVFCDRDNLLHVMDRASGSPISTIAAADARRANFEIIGPDQAVSYQSGSDSAPGEVGLRVWDLASGVCRHLLECEFGAVLDVCSVMNGAAVCARYEHAVVVWSVVSGERLWAVQVRQEIKPLATARDGRLIVCSDGEHKWSVIDAQSGTTFRSLHGAALKAPVCITEDGMVVAVSAERDLEVWDLDSGVRLRTLRGHAARIASLTMTAPDRLASVSDDGTIRLWDLAGARSRRSSEASASRGASPALLPDGRAGVISDGTLDVWSLETGARDLHLEADKGRVEAFETTPDGRVLARCTDDAVRIWRLSDGALLHRLSGHADRITRLLLLSDDRAATTGDDGTLRLWDIASGIQIGGGAGHAATITDVHRLEDGRLVTGGDDGWLVVWSPAGEHLRRIKAHNGGFRITILGGDRVLTGSVGGRDRLAVWDVSSGARLRTLDEVSEVLQPIAVAPKGRLVVIAWEGIRVWNLHSGALERTMDAVPGVDWRALRELNVDADGWINASSWHSDVHRWDIATGRYLGRLNPDESTQWAKDNASGEAMAATAAGLVWRGASGAERALYPLDEKPKAVFDVRRRRALLVEGKSAEIHILQVRRDANAPASETAESDPWLSSGVTPQLVLQEESRQKRSNVELGVGFVIVLSVAAFGAGLGFVHPLLRWIGVPIAVVAGLFAILSAFGAVLHHGKPRTAYDLLVLAAKRRAERDFAGAVKIVEQVVRDCRALKNADALALALVEYGVALNEDGRGDDALAALDEAERIIASDTSVYYRAVFAQYSILRARFVADRTGGRRVVEAIDKLEGIARRRGEDQLPLALAAERARILWAMGEKAEAMQSLVDASLEAGKSAEERIYEILGIGKLDEEQKLAILRANEDHDAQEFVKAAYAKRLPGKEAQILEQEAQSLDKIGDLPGALRAYEQIEQIGRAKNDDFKIAASLSNQGYLHARMGRLDDANRLFGAGVDLMRTVGDAKWLAFILRTYAVALRDNNGDLDHALVLAEESGRIEKDRNDDDSWLHSVEIEASIHLRRRAWSQELECLTKAADCLRAMGRESELVVTLRRTTAALREANPENQAIALPVFDEMIEVCGKIGDDYHLAIATSERGVIEGLSLGRFAEGTARVREARTILRRLGKDDEVRQADRILGWIEQKERESAKRQSALPVTIHSILSEAGEALGDNALRSLDIALGGKAVDLLRVHVVAGRDTGDKAAISVAQAALAAAMAQGYGTLEDVSAAACEAGDLAQHDDVAHVRAMVRTALAFVADAFELRAEATLDAGKDEDAQALTAQGVAVVRRLDDPVRLARTLASQVLLLSRAPDRRDDVRSLAEEARALAAAHDLADVAEEMAAITL